MLRSVWWRSSAARLPWVRSLNRWSRRDTRSSGDIDRTRAAASSIASGIPSRRRHSTATAPTLRSVSAKSLFAALARSANSRTASASDQVVTRRRRPAGTPSDGTATIRSPPSAEPLPARRQHRHLRAATAQSRRPGRATASRRCSQLSSTNNSRFAARYSSTDSSSARPGDGCTRRLAASVSHTRLRIGDRRELAQPRTVRELADDLGRDLEREAGLADPTHPGQRHQRRLRRTRLRQRRDLRLAPDERRHLTRQVPRHGIERPQRRELRGQTRRARPGRPASASARSRRRCSPRSTSSTSGGNVAAYQAARHRSDTTT